VREADDIPGRERDVLGPGCEGRAAPHAVAQGPLARAPRLLTDRPDRGPGRRSERRTPVARGSGIATERQVSRSADPHGGRGVRPEGGPRPRSARARRAPPETGGGAARVRRGRGDAASPDSARARARAARARLRWRWGSRAETPCARARRPRARSLRAERARALGSTARLV